MNVRLHDIIRSEGVLVKLFGCHPERAKDSFRIAQVQRALGPIFEDYGKAKTELLKKYAHENPNQRGHYRFVELDEQGQPVVDDAGERVIDAAAAGAFEQGHTELLEELASVEVQPLSLDMLDHLGLSPTLSPTEVLSVLWLIEEGGAEC